MAETISEPRHHELISNDESIRLVATHTPGDIHQVDIEESWPVGLTVEEVQHTLAAEAHEKGIDTHGELSDFIWNLSPRNSLDKIATAPRFTGLLANLGYSVESDTHDQNGQHITKKVCRYPSVDRANNLLFRLGVLEEDEDEPGKGITFEEFRGGEYSLEDFMTYFVEEGKVLMASDQPYQIHDMSNHLLGWIGMDPQLIDFMRAGLDDYRSLSEETEQAMKRLPLSSERRQDKDVRTFLSPASVVLQRAMSGFEVFTASLAQRFIFDQNHETIDEDFMWWVRHSTARFINLEYGDNAVGGMDLTPSGLLGKGPDRFKTAKRTQLRYLFAQQVSHDMRVA